jgi:hypothetical protein
MLLCSGFNQWKSDNDGNVPPARVKGIATGKHDKLLSQCQKWADDVI